MATVTQTRALTVHDDAFWNTLIVPFLLIVLVVGIVMDQALYLYNWPAFVANGVLVFLLVTTSFCIGESILRLANQRKMITSFLALIVMICIFMIVFILMLNLNSWLEYSQHFAGFILIPWMFCTALPLGICQQIE